MTTLSAFLNRLRSDHAAAIDETRILTYRDLDDRARRVAGGLAAAGIGAGDRVGLWLPNTREWLVLFFACARLGAIVVAVNTRFRQSEIGDVLGRSGCKALALSPAFKGIDFQGILGAVDEGALAALETLIVIGEDEGEILPGRRHISYADLEAHAPHDTDDATAESPCILFTTSGTTSAPKFVIHKHSALIAHGAAVARGFGYTEAHSRTLQATPFCGIYGFSQAMGTLSAGAPIVVMETFDAHAAIGAIHAHRVTQFCGTDDMMDRLLAATTLEHPFPSLRFFGCARFNTTLTDLPERAEARGVRIHGLFGMSETQALLTLQPAAKPLAERKLAGGVPVSPATVVRVRDTGSGALLPPGENGEVEVKGPSLMAGYWANPEATAAAFTDDGYFRTGDLGYATADGGFILLARMGDALRLGGYLVSPAEIEQHIRRHPSIDGCQVVGATVSGSPRAIAFVVMEPGGDFDEAGLRAHCAEALAKFKVPYRFLALDEFPAVMSPNGLKIQRGKLRDMAAESVGAEC
jgi:fatty-acyl-CoA synthase